MSVAITDRHFQSRLHENETVWRSACGPASNARTRGVDTLRRPIGTASGGGHGQCITFGRATKSFETMVGFAAGGEFHLAATRPLLQTSCLCRSPRLTGLPQGNARIAAAAPSVCVGHGTQHG